MDREVRRDVARYVRRLAPGELPTERPGPRRAPAHTAISAGATTDVLVAGRCDDWTFIYDTSGITGWTTGHQEMASVLVADGRVAASSIFTLNGDTSIAYAENGKSVFVVSDQYDSEEDADRTPGRLGSVS